MYPLYWEYSEVNDKYFRKIENECDFFFRVEFIQKPSENITILGDGNEKAEICEIDISARISSL